MMDKDNNILQEDLLMKYISGQATLNEIAQVSLALKNNPSLKDLLSILEKMDANGSLSEDGAGIPLADCAGVSADDDNLCGVLCEKYILRNYLTDEEYAKIDALGCELRQKDAGTPLHKIGSILSEFGMQVSRIVDATLPDLASALRNGLKVIAVVDCGQLWDGCENGVLHAVVCIGEEDGYLKVYDPGTLAVRFYAKEDFAKAWTASDRYMVTASAKEVGYVPHPVDISTVRLEEELIELTDAIAENSHEIWAKRKLQEGWKYGPKRDDDNLEHPDLVPYNTLPESEKNYDRDSAMQTIRLVKRLGYSIHRNYTLYCPDCGEFVSGEMNFCPMCGFRLKEKE